MNRSLLAVVLLLSASVFSMGQTLPVGKWRLAKYRFGASPEKPFAAIQSTLVIGPDGKLGGNSGCNAYGGSYSIEGGKLEITDIISTMRACEEPTPQFEKNFFNTLESAVSAKVKDNKLVLTDKDGRYLHFVRIDR